VLVGGVPTALVVGIARKLDVFSFADDFNHLAGTMRLDVLPCATPLTCPDPTLASEADWGPFNPPPAPSEFAIRASRISNVPYDE